MARRPSTSSPGAPRGIRFDDELRDRLMELAAATQRTFSDMVLHLVRRGLDAVNQDEKDRLEGERARRSRESASRAKGSK